MKLNYHHIFAVIFTSLFFVSTSLAQTTKNMQDGDQVHSFYSNVQKLLRFVFQQNEIQFVRSRPKVEEQTSVAFRARTRTRFMKKDSYEL